MCNLDYRRVTHKYNIGMKTLLQQGLSELWLYGDWGYKLRKITSTPNSNLFRNNQKRIMIRYKIKVTLLIKCRLIQSRLRVEVSSTVARRWVGPQTKRRRPPKLINLSVREDLVSSAGPDLWFPFALALKCTESLTLLRHSFLMILYFVLWCVTAK